jgi:hypothetical protein
MIKSVLPLCPFFFFLLDWEALLAEAPDRWRCFDEFHLQGSDGRAR